MTSLRLFVLVCETRSIARASEQAAIVGSAISKRLAQLEDTVGTPLFVRRRRGVEPTAAGESLLEHARAVLSNIDKIERDMAAYAGGVRGHVRVLATASTVAESLPEDLANFLHDPAHKDIQVDIEERISSEVLRGLREGSASVGICWDAADFEGLQSIPYRRDTLCIAVHPAHPLAAKERVTLSDALDHGHVGLPSLSAVQVMLQRAAAMIGKPLRYRATVSTFDAAMRVVRANLAISIVPQQIAGPYAKAFDLRIVALDEPWTQRRFVICFRDTASLSPAAKLLVEHLRRAAANE